MTTEESAQIKWLKQVSGELRWPGQMLQNARSGTVRAAMPTIGLLPRTAGLCVFSLTSLVTRRDAGIVAWTF
jgi:hypothetical protein